MTEARTLLEKYVTTGKVLQLATVRPDGSPVACNLWFASRLLPDRLWFISRPAREHCANLRADPRVAGAILTTMPDVLGEGPCVGVGFRGTARELPVTGVDEQIAGYAGRWPSAANAIDPRRLAAGEAHHRVYEIDVTEWVLFDEDNFPDAPRQVVAAH